MGSGAATLSQGFPQYSSVERHIRLHGPGRSFHGQVVVITISRIPEIEIEELDRLQFGTPNDEPLDYDYDDTEAEVEEWVRVTRF